MPNLPAACILVLLAPAAQARCVTAADLALGVAFTRADHRAGMVVSAGDALTIDYATSHTSAWTDARSSLMGVFDLAADFHFNDAPTVGGGSPRFVWTFRKHPPVPTPGTAFTTTVRQVRSEDIGTQFPKPDDVVSYTATYTFLDAKAVTISGCPYTVIPVEAAFAPINATQRWLYFPDLGFGIETRTRGFDHETPHNNGITALEPAK